MTRDQIIVGTLNDDIRKNALNNQWNLETLIKNGRKLGAATTGAKKLTSDDQHSSEKNVNRVCG